MKNNKVENQIVKKFWNTPKLDELGNLREIIKSNTGKTFIDNDGSASSGNVEMSMPGFGMDFPTQTPTS